MLKRSFCQDRLGTNIGKHSKTRPLFLAGEPNNALYSFNGRDDITEDVTAFNLWCTPADGDCCAARTCPAWNDNHENREYTFICEEHNRAQGGGH